MSVSGPDLLSGVISGRNLRESLSLSSLLVHPQADTPQVTVKTPSNDNGEHPYLTAEHRGAPGAVEDPARMKYLGWMVRLPSDRKSVV